MSNIKPSAYFSSNTRASSKASSRLISVRLPEELLQRLARVGNNEGLAMSDTIRLVLERGLREKKKKKKKETKP